MSTVQAQQGVAPAGAAARAPAAWNQPANIAMIALLTLSLAALFFRWFLKQSEFSWRQVEDWGHAFFVPLIAAYLIWQRRDQIARATPTVFWPGMLAVLTGILGYLTFSIGPIPGVHMGQGLFVILTIWGAALVVLGPGVTRWLMLPAAYLVFMITVSEGVMLRITWPLQLLASDGAYIILSLIGMLFDFKVEVDGNVLTVISSTGVAHPLNVAEACSGMRMAVAFIALAGAVALLSSREWWKRIALMLLSIPVALLMNVARVAILGLATLRDSNLAAGEAHTLIGTLLLLPGLGLFLAVGWALEKVAPSPKPPKPIKAQHSLRLRLARPAGFTLLALLATSALGIGWAIDSYKIHLNKLPIYAEGGRVVASIPRETDSWVQVGSDRIVEAEVLEELGTTNYVSRAFMEKNPAPGQRPRVVDLHMAYYTDQIDTVPHVPERCFVGAGISQTGASVTLPLNLDRSAWTLDQGASTPQQSIYTASTSRRWSDSRGRRVRLPRDIENAAVRASVYHSPGGGQLFAGYFFIANGGIASSAEQVRYLAFDLKNDYAFYLKVQFTSQTVASTEEFAAVSSELLDELLADIMLCVPDWVEVESGRYPTAGGESTSSTGE